MKYMKLDQKGSAMAEYVWIDAVGGVRSKSRVRNLPSLLSLSNYLSFCYSIDSCHESKPYPLLVGTLAA